MRRRALALLAAGLGAAALWVATRRPLPVEGEPAEDPLRVRGALHVHTAASDGGRPALEVIEAARGAGLDFLVLTDHNGVAGKELEGYHGSLLVSAGTEISTSEGHVLAIGLEAPGYLFSGDGRDALEDVASLGGIAFAAHPDSPEPELRWAGGRLPGPWGLEVWNGDSQWRHAGWWRLARALAAYPFNPRRALLGALTRPGSLALWDELLAERDVPGVAGADAHGQFRLGEHVALPMPSYASSFGLVRNHVLLEEPPSGAAGPDLRRLVDALGRGRSYVSVDALAPGDGFYFHVAGPDRDWDMGETAAPGPELRARAGGPAPAGTELRLLRDGVVIEASGTALDVPVGGPGVYRVEAHVPGWPIPWIVSNPVYVFDAAAAARRHERAAMPAPPPEPPESVVIESFDPGSGFAAEHDESSGMPGEVVAPGSGPDASAAARLAFRLGTPGPGRPYTWCALVERAPRDLSGREGLLLRVRADGSYRFWVQVRDRNPDSADEGQEWWFASVRTSPEWRQVRLPFRRFRSINPASDGALDLDAIVGLVLLVDLGAAPPGAEGTIWIDDLRAY